MDDEPNEQLVALLRLPTEIEAWAAGRRIGLEQAAYCIEQLGGTNSFLISPDVAAREIRALKDKDK